MTTPVPPVPALPFTAEQYEAAKETIAPPPVGTTADPGTVAAVAQSGAAPGETDLDELKKQIAALTARLDAQQAAAPAGVHPLIGTVRALRELIGIHVNTTRSAKNHAPAVALADQLVTDAGAAVDTGDTTAVRATAGKLERALIKAAPDPGDNHHYEQALDSVRFHVPDAADTVAVS